MIQQQQSMTLSPYMELYNFVVPKDNMLRQDAKVGHKSADSSFFGYKTHLAMTEGRIITAAVVTTGEKNDGKQLQTLIEKSKATGMEVKSVIGDMAIFTVNLKRILKLMK